MNLDKIIFPALRATMTLCIAILLIIGWQNSSLAACVDYQTQVNQAVQAQDLGTLESLLMTLQGTDCSRGYIDWLERSMAQIAAAQADMFAQQNKWTQAKTLLERAPTIVWASQVVRGDIAAHHKQWQKAAQFYNQALDLIADPQLTPQSPPSAVIRKIYRLASESQILANNLNASISRSGQANGMMRNNVRGFKPRERLIPIQFGFGKTRLTEKGKAAASRLIAYLKQHDFSSVTLIGHTDSKGKHRVNDRISKQRALTLKQYLVNSGIHANIMTTGKGKREPLELDNSENYTSDEIDALNRRVEFVAE